MEFEDKYQRFMLRANLALKLAVQGHKIPLESFVNEEKAYAELKEFNAPVPQADNLMHNLRIFYPHNFSQLVKAPYMLTAVEKMMEKQAAETLARLGLIAFRTCKDCEYPVKFEDVELFIHHLYARHGYDMVRQLRAAFSKDFISTRPLRYSDTIQI